jgi:HlyD family secretion protein
MLTPEQQAKYDQMREGQASRGGTAGRVFVLDAEGKLQPVQVQLGVTDGSSTEVLRGELKDGQEVVIGAAGTGAAGQRGPGQPPTAPRVRL